MRSRRVLPFLMAFIVPLTAHPDEDPQEKLWAAARKGHSQTVRALVAGGIDVNARTPYGATALSYAVDKGHTGVVKSQP